jgi:hypothetical protein
MAKTTKQRSPKRNRTDSAGADVKLYWKLRRSGPAITEAELDQIELTEQDPKNHMWRRAALAFLLMPCEQLFSKIDSDREAAVVFAESAQGIRDYTSSLRELARILEIASTRIELGLCKRDDYYDVLAEAKVERKASKRLARRNNAGVAHG